MKVLRPSDQSSVCSYCEFDLSAPSNLCMDGHHGFCCSGGGAITNQVPVEDMVKSVWLQGWLSTIAMVDPIEAEAGISL